MIYQYKNYKIDTIVNDMGYYEATPIDCDGKMIYTRSIEQLRTEIDEI